MKGPVTHFVIVVVNFAVKVLKNSPSWKLMCCSYKYYKQNA